MNNQIEQSGRKVDRNFRKRVVGPVAAAFLTLAALPGCGDKQTPTPTPTPIPSGNVGKITVDSIELGPTAMADISKAIATVAEMAVATAVAKTKDQKPTATATATATATPRPTETAIPQPTETRKPTETSVSPTKELQFEIGSAEKVNLSGLQWYPDGHVSFIKMPNNELRFWIAGLQSGYMTTGESINALTKAEKVIGPSRTEDFDRNYAAPGSVIPGKNENELLMFYHGEYHPKQPTSFPFKAGVGLAISQDGGKTWERKGQVIKGNNDKIEKDKPSGAGQPSAIIIDNYIFLYYIDWNSEYPDAIHLARAPINTDGMPGSWEKYSKGSFKDKEADDLSSPVVFPPEGQGYAALPGVSWNKYLNKFLMVFEARDGFYVTTSSDGINWSSSISLLKVKTANDNPKSGEIWNSYPTFISLKTPSDRETNKEMLLIHSQGKWGQGPHSMVKREINLK